jgi:drug/metabolite transporter (DMT)-like permease
MVLAVMGQFLLKKGVGMSNLLPNFISIIKTLFHPFVFLGISLYAISSIVWLFVLKKFELSVAYPSLALTYIAVVLISVFFFKEPLTINKIIGVILIFLGVFFIYK